MTQPLNRRQFVQQSAAVAGTASNRARSFLRCSSVLISARGRGPALTASLPHPADRSDGAAA